MILCQGLLSINSNIEPRKLSQISKHQRRELKIKEDEEILKLAKEKQKEQDFKEFKAMVNHIKMTILQSNGQKIYLFDQFCKMVHHICLHFKTTVNGNNVTVNTANFAVMMQEEALQVLRKTIFCEKRKAEEMGQETKKMMYQHGCCEYRIWEQWYICTLGQ